MAAKPREPYAIGPAVRRLREDRGISQAELARRATEHYSGNGKSKGKVDPSHISRVESGEYASPRQPLLIALAKALNCDLAEITGSAAVSRELTPYERNSDVRALVDALVDLSPDDRRHLQGLIGLLAAAVSSLGDGQEPRALRFDGIQGDEVDLMRDDEVDLHLKTNQPPNGFDSRRLGGDRPYSLNRPKAVAKKPKP